MLIFIIFPFLSLSCAVSIKGNWKDSSLKDETLIFFEKVEPSLLNKVESSLKSVDKDDQSQILNSLSNFVYQPLFGLLNLSLSLRYFNPIASIKSPKEGNSTLHGWYLYEKKKNPINTRDYQNVHFTLIKGIDNHKTAREKLNYVNKASLSIESLITPNRNFKLYDRAKNTLKKYPQNYCYSGINGRIVKPQYFDILDGLIEEYRNSKLFSFSNALLYQNGYRQPYYFTKQLINCQDLPPFNVEKLIEKWSDEPKLKSTNYMEVLKCKKPIVTVNIYFDLRSPESPALLNWAIEHVLKSDPIYFNFTLYFDINNETEKHIGYAWHQSVDTLGVRNSILFMIDGFKKKNFKRAYKATLPTISWKKLKKNMVDDHKQTIRINEQLNYCREKNITVAASINGEFIQERPIFPIIENKVFAYINRIKSGVENGDHINFSQIIEWTQKNSIEMTTSNCPIEITYNNYITINGFSNEIINSTANKIISLTKENSYKYPLIFFNSKKTSKYDVDISQFSEEEIQFLKANKNDIFTIFGPLVFKGIVLTENQLKFVQDYIDYVFITNNLEPKLSKEKVLLSLYYRSTNALDGIERKSIINNLSDSLKIELKSNSTLKWEIVDDPLSFNGPLILEMAAHVYDSGAASVIYYPNVKHSEYSSIPPHFNFHFRSSFNQDEVEIENKNYYLQTSPYWTVRKERNEEQFTCTSIITSSLLFASPGKKVKISDFYVTSTNDIGYLSPVLPVGKYEIEGMSSKSTVEKGNNYYYVDNFVPHCHFYFDNGERILSTSDSNELNIVLTPENESEQIKTEMKVLLYSILKNIKKTTKVKVFVASSFPFEMIKNVEIQVIPFYMPHFYEMKKASKKQLVDNWKFILSDIYLPNEKHYLFVDNKMLFVGDASRFLRLDMSSDSVVASPVMTERWFFDREELPWNSRKYLMMRFKRPYHTSSLIWIYMERWTDLHIGDRFRSILMSYIEANEKDQKIGEVIFNSIQLYAQFITLPEEIAFNSGRSSSSLAKNALSIDLTSFEGIRMAGIKYEKIKQQAFEEFE